MLFRSLRVAPVTIKLAHGKSMSTVHIWNDGRKPMQVQARIFREEKQGGQKRLVATRDVVVSPPMASLAPGTENTIRIVRVNKSPVTSSEHYRLVVDEVPNPKDIKAGQVRIMVRHAIPVVFQ